jgi:RNA polymerase sigma-70 factor (ECF subfamily)
MDIVFRSMTRPPRRSASMCVPTVVFNIRYTFHRELSRNPTVPKWRYAAKTGHSLVGREKIRAAGGWSMADQFPTTRWSLVLAGSQRANPDARDALEELCRSYWFPIYARARMLGNDPDDARDRTQSFFARVLEKNTLSVADPERGRFRAFLKVAFEHHVANEHRRQRAERRGGGKEPLRLDVDEAESQYRSEPVATSTPEVEFERQWARVLLARALERLEAEMTENQEGVRYRLLEPYLTGRHTGKTYAQIAKALGSTDGAVRMAIHRMRKRWGEILRDEISQTVADPQQVDDELRHLFAVLDS